MIANSLFSKWCLSVVFLTIAFGYIAFAALFPEISAEKVTESFPVSWAVFLAFTSLVLIVLGSTIYAVRANAREILPEPKSKTSASGETP